MKGILVDALHRKLHAAITAVKPTVVDEAWKEMEKWVTKIDKYTILAYRREFQSGRYGFALKHLLVMLGDGKDGSGSYPKKSKVWKELIKLCKKLEWESWEKYALASLPTLFPNDV